MSVRDNLRAIASEAEPLLEQQINLADELAALRDAAKERGLDWGALKALLVARIRDNADGGDRLKKLSEKFDTSLTYADMLSSPIVAEKHKKSATISIASELVSPPAGDGAVATSPTAPPIPAAQPAAPHISDRSATACSAGPFLSHDPNDQADIRNQPFYRGEVQ